MCKKINVLLLLMVFCSQQMLPSESPIQWSAISSPPPGSTTLYATGNSRIIINGGVVPKLHQAVALDNSIISVNGGLLIDPIEGLQRFVKFMDNVSTHNAELSMQSAFVFGACVACLGLSISLTWNPASRNIFRKDLKAFLAKARQGMSDVWNYWRKNGALLISEFYIKTASTKSSGIEASNLNAGHGSHIIISGNNIRANSISATQGSSIKIISNS